MVFFPFGNLKNRKFIGFINSTNNESKNSNLVLRPPSDLVLLFNEFNNTISENNSDPDNVQGLISGDNTGKIWAHRFFAK